MLCLAEWRQVYMEPQTKFQLSYKLLVTRRILVSLSGAESDDVFEFSENLSFVANTIGSMSRICMNLLLCYVFNQISMNMLHSRVLPFKIIKTYSTVLLGHRCEISIIGIPIDTVWLKTTVKCTSIFDIVNKFQKTSWSSSKGVCHALNKMYASSNILSEVFF